MSLRRLIALWGSVCLLLMLVALPFLVACAEPASTPMEKPIVLGVPLSTGFSDGRDAEWGMRLAVEEINARGGVNVGGVRYPFKIEVMDTRDLEPRWLQRHELRADDTASASDHLPLVADLRWIERKR